MLGRKKKREAQATTAAAQEAVAEELDEATTEMAAAPEPEPEPAPAPVPEPPAPVAASAPMTARADDGMPLREQRPTNPGGISASYDDGPPSTATIGSYQPPEVQGQREAPLNSYLSVQNLMSDAPRKPEEQRQREAAAELEAAFAASRQLLLQEVPGASSPEEAAQQLMDRQNQREVLPDQEGDRLSGSDIYWSDSSVYYRVRKQFKWGPQRGPYKKAWTPPPGLARPEIDSARGRLPSA